MNANPCFELDLDDGSTGVFVRGWGIREPHGRWMVAEDAILFLPGMPAPSGMVLELQLMPFVAAEKLPFQEVVFFVNETRCFAVRLERWQTVRFALPEGATRAGAPIRLRLHANQAASPHDVLGSNDGRKLSVSLGRLACWDTASAAAQNLALSADDPTISAPSANPAPRIAAVTMVYNESVFLPIWLRHYGRQIGLENCIVIDHGSDDGSTGNLGGAGRVALPRSAYDPQRQSRFNSEFCSSLLEFYDYVIYSDADELLVVDPRVAPDLATYCRRDLPEVVTAIGLNSLHCFESEPALDLARPITAQRPYVFPTSSMCKPLLIRRPVTWAAGSHSADAPTVFDHLYLFHLRWFDLPQAMLRLQKTRVMPWARTDSGHYQRMTDDESVALHARFIRRPAIDDMDFDPGSGPIGGFVDEVLASRNDDPATPYRISLNIWRAERWRIPQRFVGVF